MIVVYVIGPMLLDWMIFQHSNLVGLDQSIDVSVSSILSQNLLKCGGKRGKMGNCN